MWQKVGVALVAVLIVGLGLAYVSTGQEQSDEAKINSITFVFKEVDGDITESDLSMDDGNTLATMTMDIPDKISLLDTIARDFNTGELTTTETKTVDTDIETGTQIVCWTVVDVWWEATDLKSINYVKLEQSVHDGSGHPFINRQTGDEVLSATYEDLSVAEHDTYSEAFPIDPRNPGFFDYVHYDPIEDDHIIIDTTDGSVWWNNITVDANTKAGGTITKTLNLKTTLEVNYIEYDSSIEIHGTVDDMNTD